VTLALAIVALLVLGAIAVLALSEPSE